MEELANRLRLLLEHTFPGCEVLLDEPVPSEKIGGFLIWAGFDGMEQLDRQHKVWDVIRSSLPRSDQLQISAILTVTPDERSVPSES